MTRDIVYFVLMAVGGFLGVYVFFALARDGWRKWMGPACLSMIFAIVAATTILAFGLPRPLWSLAYDNREYRLISWSYVEGKAIYVWLMPYKGGDPIVVEMPWDERKADEISTIVDQLKLNGKIGNMKPGALARGFFGPSIEPGDLPIQNEPLKKGE